MGRVKETITVRVEWDALQITAALSKPMMDAYLISRDEQEKRFVEKDYDYNAISPLDLVPANVLLIANALGYTQRPSSSIGPVADGYVTWGFYR